VGLNAVGDQEMDSEKYGHALVGFIMCLIMAANSFADSLYPVNVAITSYNAQTSGETGISTSDVFIDFTSEFGFVYETLGLPVIGEHYPFNKAVPDKVRTEKYGPDTSLGSVIIPATITKNAGVKAFVGITRQTTKLIWLGIAVLAGVIAESSRKIVSNFVKKDSGFLKYLFWYGFSAGFFLGIFVIDDISNLFGQNVLVYFDNANSSSCRIVIGKHKTAKIGANENMGIYIAKDWNELEVRPDSEELQAWSGRIYAGESKGYFVFNIGGKNQYNVRTAAWGK
jgi:hypothetical protein